MLDQVFFALISNEYFLYWTNHHFYYACNSSEHNQISQGLWKVSDGGCSLWRFISDAYFDTYNWNIHTAHWNVYGIDRLELSKPQLGNEALYRQFYCQCGYTEIGRAHV